VRKGVGNDWNTSASGLSYDIRILGKKRKYHKEKKEALVHVYVSSPAQWTKS